MVSLLMTPTYSLHSPAQAVTSNLHWHIKIKKETKPGFRLNTRKIKSSAHFLLQSRSSPRNRRCLDLQLPYFPVLPSPVQSQLFGCCSSTPEFLVSWKYFNRQRSESALRNASWTIEHKTHTTPWLTDAKSNQRHSKARRASVKKERQQERSRGRIWREESWNSDRCILFHTHFQPRMLTHSHTHTLTQPLTPTHTPHKEREWSARQ